MPRWPRSYPCVRGEGERQVDRLRRRPRAPAGSRRRARREAMTPHRTSSRRLRVSTHRTLMDCVTGSLPSVPATFSWDPSGSAPPARTVIRATERTHAIPMRTRARTPASRGSLPRAMTGTPARWIPAIRRRRLRAIRASTPRHTREIATSPRAWPAPPTPRGWRQSVTGLREASTRGTPSRCLSRRCRGTATTTEISVGRARPGHSRARARRGKGFRMSH
jgi:hypothetical protein